MEIQHTKFANTVLYLISNCTGGRPGLTKLLKLLYHADVQHYRHHLAPITGLKYVAVPRGPVPDRYEDLLGGLVHAGIISRADVPVNGYPQPKEEYSANREPSPSVFSDAELATLDEVIRRYGGKSGKDLSSRTHADGGTWSWVWDPANQGKPIPYQLERWMDNACDERDLELVGRLLDDPETKALLETLDRRDPIDAREV